MNTYETCQSASTRIILFSVVLLTGCDGLPAMDGAGFDVLRITTEMPFPGYQRLEPIEVPFELNGCESFSLFLEDSEPGGASRLVKHRRVASGEFVATVPLGVLNDLSCASIRNSVTFRALCEDGREAESLFIQLNWQSRAWANLSRRVANFDFSASVVLEGNSLDQFFLASRNTISWINLKSGADTGAAPTISVLGSDEVPISDHPRLARLGDEVFLAAGCPLPRCNPVAIKDPAHNIVEVLATFVYRVILSTPLPPTTGLPPDEPVPAVQIAAEVPLMIPGEVVDMRFDDEGDLLVLSQTETFPVLSVIRGVDIEYRIQEFGEASNLVRLFDGRVVVLKRIEPTIFQGPGFFPQHLELSSVQGETINDRVVDLPRIDILSLSPSGEHFIVIDVNHSVWLSSTMSDELRKLYESSDVNPGFTWTSDGIAVWVDTKFSFFRHDGGKIEDVNVSAPIQTIAVSDDRFVVTSRDGVRIFDRDGNLQGGLAPIGCNVETGLLSDAVVVDGSHAIVLGDDALYALEVQAQ